MAPNLRRLRQGRRGLLRGRAIASWSCSLGSLGALRTLSSLWSPALESLVTTGSLSALVASGVRVDCRDEGQIEVAQPATDRRRSPEGDDQPFEDLF